MKQVIVVNAALNLPVGKLAAQVAHAAILAFMEADVEAKQAWLQVGMPKIVLRCVDEAALLKLYEIGKEHKIPAYLVQDAGKTILKTGTRTCLGLGPADAAAIDRITGMLKLL